MYASTTGVTDANYVVDVSATEGHLVMHRANA
jgi:hypothetical protein